MKLFCKGFNLFSQLNANKPIIKDFTQTFEFEVIKQVCINHSYTLLVTNTDYLLFQQDKVIKFNSLIKKDIVLLSSNDDQIIFVDTEKKLFNSCLDDFSSFRQLFSVNSLDLSSLFAKLSCGSKLIVAYLCDGTIYNVPQKLMFKNSDIVDIQSGKEHCLLLDKAGNIYSFGKGSRGQLGHGILDEELEPQLIEALAGIKIHKIAAGGWHSCAISQDGDLYVWGWNSNGQVGLGIDEEDRNFIAVMATPQLIEFEDDDLNAVFVACGSRHTIVLLDNKQVLGCGFNKYYQLTRQNQQNYFKFTHLHDFKNEEVVNLYCGPWNSAVLCQ